MASRGTWSVEETEGGFVIRRADDGYVLGSGQPYRMDAPVGSPEWESEVGDTVVAVSTRMDATRLASGAMVFKDRSNTEAVLMLLRDLIKCGVVVPSWVWWAWAHGWRPIHARWVEQIREASK